MSYFTRRAQVVAAIEKANKNHDCTTGHFCSGPGGKGSGKHSLPLTPAKTRRSIHAHPKNKK